MQIGVILTLWVLGANERAMVSLGVSPHTPNSFRFGAETVRKWSYFLPSSPPHDELLVEGIAIYSAKVFSAINPLLHFMAASFYIISFPQCFAA